MPVVPDFQTPECGVCGEQLRLATPGSFGLPIIDPFTGLPFAGPCCAICGPKIDAFIEQQCTPIKSLPDGPLKSRLLLLRDINAGLITLGLISWLAERAAKIKFASEAASPEPLVTVTAMIRGGAEVASGACLEDAVRELQARERSPHEPLH